MSKWIDLNLAERKVILQSVEDKEKLQQAAAIEKDWWVTAVLKALQYSVLCIVLLHPNHRLPDQAQWDLLQW